MIKIVVKGFYFGIGFSLALGFSLFVLNIMSPHVFFRAITDIDTEGLSASEILNETRVIVRTSYIDGQEIISEIVKRDSLAEYQYQEGDEYTPKRLGVGDQNWSGDGRIILLVDYPLEERVRLSYDHEDLSKFNYNVTEFLLGGHL